EPLYLVKIFVPVLARLVDIAWDRAEPNGDFCQMIGFQRLVLTLLVCAFNRLEEVTSNGTLECHASRAPDIRVRIVISEDHHFRRLVLPCLNLIHEVMVSVAPVSQISDLDL
ncbi:hypothetical protein PENTCL1PPCAC_8631, partial [Pristionchus entomophagus]